jgi:hypothetical protein
MACRDDKRISAQSGAHHRVIPDLAAELCLQAPLSWQKCRELRGGQETGRDRRETSAIAYMLDLRISFGAVLTGAVRQRRSGTPAAKPGRVVDLASLREITTGRQENRRSVTEGFAPHSMFSAPSDADAAIFSATPRFPSAMRERETLSCPATRSASHTRRPARC